MAASVAASFAMAASVANGSPASLSRAASTYSARADATAVAMSASMKDSPWNSLMGRPNCRLSPA